MMHRNTLLFIVGLVAVVTGLVAVSEYGKNKTITTGNAERSAKDALTILSEATGNRHPVVNQNLRGKIVVINVWNTHCAACIEEMPELNQLAADFKTDKVVFLGLDDMEVMEEAQAMMAANLQFDYRLLYGEQQLIITLYNMALPFEAPSMPLTVVLNPEGKIQFYYFNRDAEKLKELRDYLSSATK